MGIDSSDQVLGFGKLLTTRRRAVSDRIVFSLLAIFLGGVGLGMIVMGLAELVSPPTTKVRQPSSAKGAAIVFGIGLCLAWLAWKALGPVLSRYDFYERGVARSRLGRVDRAIAYGRVAVLSYVARREYARATYVGTLVEMVVEGLPLERAKGTRIAFRARHRERPGDVLSITRFGRNFVGADELDSVKSIISATVAERWMLDRALREDWCRTMWLTTSGLELKKGARRGMLLAYGDIRGISEEGTNLRVQIASGSRGFVLIPTSGRNF